MLLLVVVVCRCHERPVCQAVNDRDQEPATTLCGGCMQQALPQGVHGNPSQNIGAHQLPHAQYIMSIGLSILRNSSCLYYRQELVAQPVLCHVCDRSGSEQGCLGCARTRFLGKL